MDIVVDGIYDINSKSTIFSHPDAVNQHYIRLRGNQGVTTKDNHIYLPSRITNSYSVPEYTYATLIETNVSNIKIENLHISGYEQSPGISTRLMTQPYGTLVLNNVEFGPNFSGLFNSRWSNRNIDLYNYCAFSSMSLNSPTESFHVNTTSDNVHDLSTFDLGSANGVKVVFKNISYNTIGNLSRSDGTPYIGKAYVYDIVLDNVTCKISDVFFGAKRSE